MMTKLGWAGRWFLGCMSLMGVGCGEAVNSEDLGALEQGLTVRSVRAGTDATIRQSKPTTADGSSRLCEVSVLNQRTTKCLIRWSLVDIPASATVTSAELELFGGSRPNGATFDVLRASKQWTESGATWNTYAAPSKWQLPGAEGALDHGSVVASFRANSFGSVTAQLNQQGIAMVQAWVRDDAANAGVIVQPGIPKFVGRRFAIESSESASPGLRPLLRVTYE